MDAVINRDFKFEPTEYWANVSPTARDFVSYCLTCDPKMRPTVDQCLQHKWLADEKPHFVEDTTSPIGGPVDLLPNVKKNFNPRKVFRKAVLSTIAMRRFSTSNGGGRAEMTGEMKRLMEEVERAKEDAEKEEVDEERQLLYAHTHEHPDDSSDVGSPRTPYFTPGHARGPSGSGGAGREGESLSMHMARASLH